MKGIEDLQLPDEVWYSANHEWVKVEGNEAVVGITDYAQDQLGDIVFVELPGVGEHFDAEQEFGTVESVKAVSELNMPVAGEIVAVNGALEESPGLVNTSPHGEGWMIRVALEDGGVPETLLNREAYVTLLRGMD